mgnify:CR=1 FL=1
MNDKLYAHSLPGEPPEKWQPLGEHLRNVAEKAKEFAAKFGAGEWGPWVRDCGIM